MTYTERDQILKIWEMIDTDCFELEQCESECRQLLETWIDRLQQGDQQYFSNYMEYFCGIKNKSLKELTCHVEKCYLIWALLKFQGNQSKAAKFLDIDYKTIARKIKGYNIKVHTVGSDSKKKCPVNQIMPE
jgi:DNA-binding protein Fis